MPTTTTAQQIANATAQDVQARLGAEHPALLDYCNRVQLEILKFSRWKFTMSAPQRFLTKKGQTDYWIGAVGTGPNYQTDTALNLTDVEFVKQGTVFDRSNFRLLMRTSEPPNLTKMSYQDASFRLDRPKLWRYDANSPNTFSIYPAPDNQNGYQLVPETPVVSTSAAGALAAATLDVQVTFVDSASGESLPSGIATIYVPANHVLVVGPPQPGFASNDEGINYNTYNVYAAKHGSTLTLQNTSPVSTSNAWTEPTSGLTTTGATPPTSPSIAQLGGYIIEFRYFKQRPQVTALATVLTVPDEYKDVVIAGVNAKAYPLLGMQYAGEAAFWAQQYAEGLRGIVRDANLFPRGGEFMRPDAAALSKTLPAIETLDPSITQV